MIIRLVYIISLLVILSSCAKNKDDIYVPSKLTDPYNLYNEAFKAFKKNHFFLLIKNFQKQNSILRNQSLQQSLL